MSNVNDDDSARDGESVTVEESSSWLGRLGKSLVGIVFGVLLVIVACVLLFWNEGHAVKVAQSLSEGAGIVRTVAADKPDPANDGKLVHVIGALTASGPVTTLCGAALILAAVSIRFISFVRDDRRYR